MSTQDTTLPPLPDERAAFEAWYAEDASKDRPGWMKPSDIFELREGDHYGDHRVMLNGKWEGWKARAAIAAQAQQASPTCVWIVESKTFSALYATKAEAEKYIASLPITVSGGMSISAAPVIGAQQAQGVPAADAGELDPQQALEFGRLISGYSDSFNGQQWGGICESVDRKNLAVALDHLTEAGAMLMNLAVRLLAAAPQAEPQTPAKFLSPNGELVIDALRTAMDKASVPRDFRAVLIGYFCNGWNEIIRRAAAEPQPEREPTRLETLHAWATSGEPPCNSFDKGYEAAREFVAMQLAGIGTKGGE